MDKEQKKLIKKTMKEIQEIIEILNNVEKISRSKKIKMQHLLLDLISISVKIKRKLNIIKYLIMIEKEIAKLDTKTNTKENNNKILILEYKICLLKEMLLRLYQHLQDKEGR